GNGFYVDGAEIEILTPPILINKGFATRLTDSLMIGRDRVVKSIPELKHTGYSMHWNLSSTKYKINSFQFENAIAIPFNLFGLTPISVGCAMRGKGESNHRRGRGPERYELLGDSINNEEQINALGLILGSYSQLINLLDNDETKNLSAIENTNFFIESDFARYFSNDLLLKNEGRYKTIKTKYGPMQLQQYMELFYKWIEPFVSALGTKKEVQNLEDFIEGRKQLEFDKIKYYNCLEDLELKESNGIYIPCELFPEIILKESKKRNIPLEGKLLGEIIKRTGEDITISEIEWDELRYNQFNNTKHSAEYCINFNEKSMQCNRCEGSAEKTSNEIKGITEIYEFAQKLNKKFPKLKESDLSLVAPENFDIKKELENVKIRTFPDDNSLNLSMDEIKKHLAKLMQDDNQVSCNSQIESLSIYFKDIFEKICKDCNKYDPGYCDARNAEEDKE
ncbi:MAG: hypothetical protein Q7S33_01700, partial [Nanoarchaeota archaeon]|nr:hypothetical protein [Nanoarchaeota archaeon]